MENERITAKEGSQGGLTDGQQAQLTRNDQAIASIRLQVSRHHGGLGRRNRCYTHECIIGNASVLLIAGGGVVKLLMTNYCRTHAGQVQKH